MAGWMLLVLGGVAAWSGYWMFRRIFGFTAQSPDD